jgi:hypothetical protein
MPNQRQPRGPGSVAGLGVDASGGPVFDPTQNVRELVESESKYQDGMRDTLKEFQTAIRVATDNLNDYKLTSEFRLQTWMRDAETKRIDQLAALRQDYQKTIADMLSESVRSTSNLVSTQLVQIQATFNERVSKLEEFRWQSAGKSSVADPALADSMAQMSAAISALATKNAEAMTQLAANIGKVNMYQSEQTGAKAHGDKSQTQANWAIALIASVILGLSGIVVTILLRH